MPVILVLLAAVFLAHFGWLLAALAAAAAVGRVIGGWLARRDDRELERRRHDAELRACADRQHAAVMAGDDRGVYGDNAPKQTVTELVNPSIAHQ